MAPLFNDQGRIVARNDEVVLWAHRRVLFAEMRRIHGVIEMLWEIHDRARQNEAVNE